MKKTVDLSGVAELAVVLSYTKEKGQEAIDLARRLNGYPNRSELNTAIKHILNSLKPGHSVRDKLGPCVGLHV
jgi:hypothetical protein